jgi:hypothetical protein
MLPPKVAISDLYIAIRYQIWIISIDANSRHLLGTEQNRGSFQWVNKAPNPMDSLHGAQ